MTIEDTREQVAFDEYDNIRYKKRAELEYERAQYLRELRADKTWEFTDEMKAWLKIWDEGMLMQFGPTSKAAEEEAYLKKIDATDFVKWREEARRARGPRRKREPEAPPKKRRRLGKK
mmetsp:Transcript_51820/g.70666  ORF Transcript_51820/g.70666 Transcript_51820/m.70666 type:complete len:118 (-) Transcript_51820:364-717(-)